MIILSCVPPTTSTFSSKGNSLFASNDEDMRRSSGRSI